MKSVLGQVGEKTKCKVILPIMTSTKMTASKGTIQGCNCQTVADEDHQIIVATKFFGVGQDQSLLQPMIKQIKNNMSDAVFKGRLLLTADTGYSSEENMKYLFKEEINAVVPITVPQF